MMTSPGSLGRCRSRLVDHTHLHTYITYLHLSNHRPSSQEFQQRQYQCQVKSDASYYSVPFTPYVTIPYYTYLPTYLPPYSQHFLHAYTYSSKQDDRIVQLCACALARYIFQHEGFPSNFFAVLAVFAVLASHYGTMSSRHRNDRRYSPNRGHRRCDVAQGGNGGKGPHQN